MPRTAFTFDRHRAVEATDADIPGVQAFYEDNPEYLQVAEGRSAGPDDGAKFVHDLPPPGFDYSDRYMMTLRDGDGRIDGLMGVLGDLPVAGVWHLGIFVAAARLYGTGFAQRAHAACEQWARSAGARWLRLGVVTQNLRGHRFWLQQGYVEVRRREGIAMAALTNTVILMVKPMTAESWEDYLLLVPRDRRE